jgi:hypothetical protein
MGGGIVTLPPMRQPEAKFKSKIIDLHAQAAHLPWHTYLSPGGPGQKPGLPDLILGSADHGIIWCEAKVGAQAKLRTLQLKTLRSLVTVGARVVIPCLAKTDLGDVVHLYGLTPHGVLLHYRDVALGDELWPAIWEALA